MVVEVGWRVEKTQKNENCGLISENVYTHASVLVGGKVIVQGGYSMMSGTLSMLYILDLTTKAWQNIPVATSPRAFHSALLVDDKIYINGGGTDKSMERWDIVTHEMETVVERSIGVSATSRRRWAHTLEFCERKRVFLMFGGEHNTNDVLSCQVDSAIWEKLSTTGAPPANRKNHASCMVGDCMYIYGGEAIGQDGRDLNDLWVLNVRRRPSWSKLEHHGNGRVGASLSYIGGRLVAYGGRTRDVAVALPKDETLFVFNILSEPPRIQREVAVLDAGIQSHLFHTAIVQGDGVVIIGGLNISASSFPPLGSICLLSINS